VASCQYTGPQYMEFLVYWFLAPVGFGIPLPHRYHINNSMNHNPTCH
jgi:hypothetical protein